METKKQSTTKTKTGTKKVAKKIVEKTHATRKTKVVLAARKPQAKLSAKPVRRTTKKVATMAAEKKSNTVKKTMHKEPFIKRAVYMLLSIILGVLLATFVDLFLELVYAKKSMEAGLTLSVHRFLGAYSYLPVSVNAVFLLAGLVFGIWLGNWGWKVVYVQHRHRMFRKA